MFQFKFLNKIFSAGQLPTSTCSSSASCPSGSSCYQGQCCPCQCPPQQVMIGICANGLMNAASCAANGASCHNGCCCSEAPKLPVCSNGQQSTMSCQHGMVSHFSLFFMFLAMWT